MLEQLVKYSYKRTWLTARPAVCEYQPCPLSEAEVGSFFAPARTDPLFTL